PRAVTADRGYGEAAVDAGLESMGVKHVVIPRKVRPGAARQTVERSRSFRHLVKWRTGSDARISCLKRDYGWSRTLTDTEAGARTWCGWGVLAHNATKVSALAVAARERQRAGPPGRTRQREVGAA